eukprot:scaffold8123_cov66-Phaeocystis_antarctica.AAC.4
MKEPVPPRPAGPTLTSASERHLPVPAVVPSISSVGTRRPISRREGSSAAASVMGQERKRDVVDMVATRDMEKSRAEAVERERPRASIQVSPMRCRRRSTRGTRERKVVGG